jgi:hypothetical protein
LGGLLGPEVRHAPPLRASLEDPAGLNEAPPDDEVRYPRRPLYDDANFDNDGWYQQTIKKAEKPHFYR